VIAQGQAANASKSARHLGIASLVLSIIGIVIGIIIIVTVVVYVFTVVQTYRSEAEKSVIFLSVKFRTDQWHRLQAGTL